MLLTREVKESDIVWQAVEQSLGSTLSDGQHVERGFSRSRRSRFAHRMDG
jgi:hypothetical protein